MAISTEKTLALCADRALAELPANANGRGEAVEPGCGDTLTVALRVTPRRMVEAAGYTITEGACAPAVACAAAAVKLALNKPVLAAYTVTAAQIGELLADETGELEPEHVHCALMAELALKRAAADYAANGAPTGA